MYTTTSVPLNMQFATMKPGSCFLCVTVQQLRHGNKNESRNLHPGESFNWSLKNRHTTLKTDAAKPKPVQASPAAAAARCTKYTKGSLLCFIHLNRLINTYVLGI